MRSSDAGAVFLYWVFAGGLAIVIALGIMEQRRHFANLDRIRTRVLVNGIRGKSSVTRLCAGALRAEGMAVVAKTTGTAARFIWPDGTEEPVYRKFGIPNIIEQVEIVRRAAALRPDALVIECMAVMPDLQELNQEKLVRSHIGIITNVREDHLQEMGPDLRDVARSLSRSMPVGGVCITAEGRYRDVLEREADRRNCRLIAVTPDDVADEELDGFAHFVFKENVAIALALAGELGISRDAALDGMWAAAPDPGALGVDEYRIGGQTLRFANVLAANDPESTLLNVERLRDQGAIFDPVVTVINCRPDRIERNAQMAAIVRDLRSKRVIVIGHPAASAISAIPRDFAGEVIDLGGAERSVEEIYRAILASAGRRASIVAIGNIHGQGEELLEYFEELGDVR